MVGAARPFDFASKNVVSFGTFRASIHRKFPRRTRSSGCSEPSAIQSASSEKLASYTCPLTSTCQISLMLFGSVILGHVTIRGVQRFGECKVFTRRGSGTRDYWDLLAAGRSLKYRPHC